MMALVASAPDDLQFAEPYTYFNGQRLPVGAMQSAPVYRVLDMDTVVSEFGGRSRLSPSNISSQGAGEHLQDVRHGPGARVRVVFGNRIA